MDLYDELEEHVKNNPAKFSEMEFVANSINRLDEMDRESANIHRKIIFLLIWHHYQTRDITCKTNKLPYGIDYFNKRLGSTSRSKSKSKSSPIMLSPLPAKQKADLNKIEERKEEHKIETIKCVLEKVPPTLQKILLAYVKFYMVED